MSIKRQHAEWLSLLEVSGPFLSSAVLMRAFPQGMPTLDDGVRGRMRVAYAEWQDDAALHRRWVDFVLGEVLGLEPRMLAMGQTLPPTVSAFIPEHGETVRPDIAVLSPQSAQQTAALPRLLIQIYPPDQALDRTVPGSRWAAKPDARMMALLRATGVRLGLVTNGEQWMLVDAPKGGTTGYISWYAQVWLDEPATLQAFAALLGARRFFGVPDADTLEGLLAESAEKQGEVTDQLGTQVRHAVELLVRALDRADEDSGRALLAGVNDTDLYEAALTVMMRLVFLFCAEERGLLLLGDPLYDQNYAMSTLGAQLRDAANATDEQVMEHRYDAWGRMLAAFRLVHGGAKHDRVTLPAYGSSLFDPERFPFLEGRAAGASLAAARPLPISNRVTLHLLESLQFLRIDGERRRLSFRALDIEQIGHVYEGLLDHTAKRADDIVLGLTGASGKEPEVTLAPLEAKRAAGDAALLDFLTEETGRSVSAIRNALSVADGAGTTGGAKPKRGRAAAAAAGHELRLGALRAACGNDEVLLARVLPWAGLIRDDDFGVPIVIHVGGVYVTQGRGRRSTGTHYTPRSLTEPVVQHTLEPQVYVGPAEGLPREQWTLRSARELLQLKVCDMAMGSGAFLVQACRYLSERLVEAWHSALGNAQSSIVNGQSSIQITPEGGPATGAPGEQLIPRDAEEQLIFARRIVADRCLYGVDKNPMAVEMAKLSLWLTTLDKGRPFTFLDHALKAGDSLVGASEDMLREWVARSGAPGARMLNADEVEQQLERARAKRRELEGFDVRNIADAERKAALLAEAEAEMQRVRVACDLLTGVKLLGLSAREQAAWNAELVAEFVATPTERLLSGEGLSQRAHDALAAAKAVPAFHWPFAFPEVFEAGGFSAFVGNPPFVGGQKISGESGSDYLAYLNATWSHTRGSADLCAYFFLRAFAWLQPGGTFGLIATNTIAQGDTRERGLDWLVANGCTVYRAINNMLWPGVAAVVVNVVHGAKSGFQGQRLLDERVVDAITSQLDEGSGVAQAKPERLRANAGKSFQGSIVLGMGFVLTEDEARRLLDKDSRNKDVLFPYLNGEDLNTHPEQKPSRWVINFHDWDLERARSYPDCLEIVERLVKPERLAYDENKNAWNRSVKERWWQFGAWRKGLDEAIAGLKSALMLPRVSKYLTVSLVEAGVVSSEQTVVVADQSVVTFAFIQSSIHEAWVRTHASTLETRLRYTPSDCYETFPLPVALADFTNVLNETGTTYLDLRRQIGLAEWIGLTTIYNRLHEQSVNTNAMRSLRIAQVYMDNAVVQAYGWTDLNLGHGFHDTPQGVRFTLAESARREVLRRLLELNHERAAQERAEAAAAGVDKLAKSGKRRVKQSKLKAAGQESLF